MTKAVREDIERMGACVSFWEKIHQKYTKEKMRSIAEKIKSSSARVIVSATFEMDIKPLLQELNELNVTDRTWILSTSFTITPNYFPRSSLRLLNGSLVLVLHAPDMLELKQTLRSLHPSKTPDDIFIHAFWETAFGCKWPTNTSSLLLEPAGGRGENLECTGMEVLEDLESIWQQLLGFCRPLLGPCDGGARVNMLRATTTAAHPERELGETGKKVCGFVCVEDEAGRVYEKMVLPYLRRVRFHTRSGEELFFDGHGDVPPAFDFVNMQIFPDGTDRLVKVGVYDSSAPQGKQIKMRGDAVMMWNTEGTQVPRSFCSESCLHGYRQSPKMGQPNCCFDCVPCPVGEISNKTDSADCWGCPEDQWPNEQQTQCDLTTLQFLSLEEPLGITLSSLAILLFLITQFVLWVFKKYKDTPIVKANNRGLSFLLLLALMLCFLSSFTFIGHPLRVNCMLRQNSFGIAFSISISTILAKTITVIIAFDARDPSSRSSRWLGPRVAYGVVLVCSLVPIIICTAWLLLDTPFPVKIQNGDTTILQCDEGSVLFFYLLLGYLGLLASISFVVAFHARNLPQSFNEAKFLTFSMLVFLAVWVSFIPAYLSTQGKYMVAVEIFAILSSGSGLLGCIFIPKCYIILWRPDLNTRQHLMQRPALK
ncbi:extracellular calcium-sensing receptor-like [Ambystoma mexicanum]|uniref:extracellular calcium-sensing receptor-like n=1 Tax=Ambystoma mexicanum TaxID=8296 RepID=UPI0037E96F02